jgi:hypothetical protein
MGFSITQKIGIGMREKKMGEPPCPTGGLFFRFFLKKLKLLRMASNVDGSMRMLSRVS